MIRRRARRRSAAGGFTLIELLTALTILAILGLMSYRGLDTVLETRRALEVESAKWRSLAGFFDRFERDVQLALERPVRAAAGDLPPFTAQGGAATRLELSRSAATQYERPRRIAYAADAQRGAVVLYLWPALDTIGAARAEAHDVLRNVARFELEYLDEKLSWQSAWHGRDPAAPLPRAVRARVVLDTGEDVVRVFALRT